MTANRADDPLRDQPPNELSHLPRRRPLPLLTRCAAPERCCYHADEPLAAATAYSAGCLLAPAQFAACQPNGPRKLRLRLTQLTIARALTGAAVSLTQMLGPALLTSPALRERHAQRRAFGLTTAATMKTTLWALLYDDVCCIA